MSIHKYYQSQYHYEHESFPEMSFKIAGVSNYQDEVSNLILGDILTMVWDCDNIYDAKAIKILHDEKMVGYVPNNNEKIKKYYFENLDQELIIINKQSIHGKSGIRVVLKEHHKEEN